MISTEVVEERLEANEDDWTLLDVRSLDEREQASIAESKHVYVGELNEGWKELDKDHHYTLMCASGMRATIAAGWLGSRGFEKLDIYLGSMGAWRSKHDTRG
jgi:hydroxyacylglutathione hydrolase